METTAVKNNESEAQRHSEGPIALSIEEQTAKIPSDTYLWAAVGAMAGSAILQVIRRKELSIFVGQWVPTLLIFGLYNKIVKVAGSDRVHSERSPHLTSV